MNKDCCGVRGERRTKTANVAEVKVCGASDVVDVCSEGESAIEDDTQTLDLRGRKDRGVVKWEGKIM